MSWSLHIRLPAGLRRNQIRDIVSAARPIGNEDCIQERDEQAFAARSAAMDMLAMSWAGAERSAVGFAINLSGHANSGHRLGRGMPPESISVFVGQIYERERAAAPVSEATADDAGETPEDASQPSSN